MNYGVLALQGAFREHMIALEGLGVEGKLVKSQDDLEGVDALILPGGESTSMMKLLDKFQMTEALKAFIGSGKPVWGTCAGMILLSDNVDGAGPYLGGMAIASKRNAYGRQLGSFTALGQVVGLKDPYPMVFVRAPELMAMGPGVEVLATLGDQVVGARYKNIWVTAFHPELTQDLRMHDYFVKSHE